MGTYILVCKLKKIVYKGYTVNSKQMTECNKLREAGINDHINPITGQQILV